jgi:hypothetical protein
MKHFNFLMLAILLTACGKKSDSAIGTASSQPSERQSLSQMPITKALQTKYDSVYLRCFLTTSVTTPAADGSVRTTQTSSNESKTSLSSDDRPYAREFELRSGTRGIESMRVVIRLKELQLSNGTLIAANGTTYRYANSPRFEAEAITESEFSFHPGVTSRRNGRMTFDIRENVETVFINSRSESPDADSNSVGYHAACVIETKAKPGYESDFTVEK